MLKKENPDKPGEIEEIPETISMQVEGEALRIHEINMRGPNAKGTLWWDAHIKTNVKGMRCTVKFYCYIDNSSKSEPPWWWEAKKSRREIETEQAKQQANGGEETE